MAESSDYTPITFYRSETADEVPLTANLAVGEFAVNIADRKIYTRNTANEIVELTNGSDHTHVASDITDLTEVVNNLIGAANYPRPTVSTQGGTTYTLDADDENSIILFTAGCTITVPANADEALEVGYITHLHQDGASQITVAAGAGVTLNSAEGTLRTRKQNSSVSLIKVASDEWNLIGDQELA